MHTRDINDLAFDLQDVHKGVVHPITYETIIKNDKLANYPVLKDIQ